MRATKAAKAAKIELNASVTKQTLSQRKLLTLISRALELLLEYAPCVTARIYKRNNERNFRIKLIDEKNRDAHQFECHLKGEGVRSELVKISVDD